MVRTIDKKMTEGWRTVRVIGIAETTPAIIIIESKRIELP